MDSYYSYYHSQRDDRIYFAVCRKGELKPVRIFYTSYDARVYIKPRPEGFSIERVTLTLCIGRLFKRQVKFIDRKKGSSPHEDFLLRTSYTFRIPLVRAKDEFVNPYEEVPTRERHVVYVSGDSFKSCFQAGSGELAYAVRFIKKWAPYKTQFLEFNHYLVSFILTGDQIDINLVPCTRTKIYKVEAVIDL